MAGLSGGAGGVSGSANSAAQSGNVRSGDRSFGGINVIPQSDNKMLYIGGAVFLGFIVLKKMKII